MPLRGITQAYHAGNVSPIRPYHTPTFSDALMQGLGRSLGSLPSAAVGMLGNYLSGVQKDQNAANQLGRQTELNQASTYGDIWDKLNSSKQDILSQVPAQAPAPAGIANQPPAQLSALPSSPIVPSSMSDTNGVLSGAIPPASLFNTPRKPAAPLFPLPDKLPNMDNLASFKLKTSSTDSGSDSFNPVEAGNLPPAVQDNRVVAHKAMDMSDNYYGVSQDRLRTRMDAIKRSAGHIKNLEPVATFDVAFSDQIEQARKAGKDTNDPMVRAHAAISATNIMKRKYGDMRGRAESIKALDTQGQAYGRLASDFLKTAQTAAGNEGRAYTALAYQAARHKAAAMSMSWKMKNPKGYGYMPLKKAMSKFVTRSMFTQLGPVEQEQYKAQIVSDMRPYIKPSDYEYIKNLPIGTFAGFVDSESKQLKNDRTRTLTDKTNADIDHMKESELLTRLKFLQDKKFRTDAQNLELQKLKLARDKFGYKKRSDAKDYDLRQIKTFVDFISKLGSDFGKYDKSKTDNALGGIAHIGDVTRGKPSK